MNQPTTDSTSDARRQARARRRLIAMFALFFVPFFGAWIWFANIDDWRPQGTSNNGELIAPAVPLLDLRLLALDGERIEPASLERSWLLVHVVRGTCAQACRQNLYHTRQARIALGKDMQRVRRLLLLAGDGHGLDLTALAREHPHLIIARDGNLAGQIEVATHAMAPADDAFYLVDPLLNLMMRFPASLDPRLVIKDLKRLLKVSRIG